MARASAAVRGARSASPLLAGLAVQAGTTYLYLVIAGHALGPAQFAALSGLYLVLTGTATGLFAPLEQEVTQRRGRERGGEPHDPTLRRRSLTLGIGTSALAAAVFLAAWPVTLELLGGERWLLVALLVALPGYACWFAFRGQLAGERRLRRYGLQLALDGAVRLVGAVLLAAADQAGIATLGLLFAISPWLTVVLTWTRDAATSGQAGVRGPRLGGRFGLLVVGALAAQLVMNAGPAIVNLLASDAERDAAGVYLAALVIIRVPVFLFSAVQPMFLPALAALSRSGGRAEFGALLGRVLLVLGAGTALVSLLATALGPTVVEWLFGFEDQLDRSVYVLLTISVGLFLVATVLAQALLGVDRHDLVAFGWLCAVPGLAVGALLPGDAVERANAALLAGASVAVVVLAACMLRELRCWSTRSRGLGRVTESTTAQRLRHDG